MKKIVIDGLVQTILPNYIIMSIDGGKFEIWLPWLKFANYRAGDRIHITFEKIGDDDEKGNRGIRGRNDNL